jgi:hypothetical protein
MDEDEIKDFEEAVHDVDDDIDAELGLGVVEDEEFEKDHN